MLEDRFPTISLFSGAQGLDLGLERLGFEVRVAVECNKFAAETIRVNSSRMQKKIELIDRKIELVDANEILTKAGLQVGEAFLLTGGPSCQSFSTAGQRGSLGDPRGGLFREFLKVVRGARPRFFVMENVPGILSAAIKHRPLKNRGPGHPPLSPEEELGSAFTLILKELSELGYRVVFDRLNAANYGVPQQRERVIIIGSRDGEDVRMPDPTHSKDGKGTLEHWVTLRHALRDLEEHEQVYSELPPSKKRFLEMVPAGGNWKHLPPELQEEALGAAFGSWGGRSGFFRRLAWDKPAPALTTNPSSKATMFGHPSELRVLSIQEYARIQQFPDGWTFAGGIPQQYLQVGNAVPVGLGEAIGKAIVKTMQAQTKGLPAGVFCANADLLNKLARRPTTILNPNRMREIKGHDAAKQWRNLSQRYRVDILDYVSSLDDDPSRDMTLEVAMSTIKRI
jgi:DNA (cytosine-5)-methyltransferase 1